MDGDNERRDIDDSMEGNEGVSILIYLLAPGSKPKRGASNKRMDLPNLEVPIVALVIKFPATEIKNEILAYAKVKGIPSDV